MKKKFNNQYLWVAFYALLVILSGILCVFTFTHFDQVWTKIVDFFNIFMPIFYGMAIAYLVYPLVKKVEFIFKKKVFGKLRDEAKRHTLSRVCSVISVYLCLLIALLVFCIWMLPHIIESCMEFWQMFSNYIELRKNDLLAQAEKAGEFAEVLTMIVKVFISTLENLYQQALDFLPNMSNLASKLINFVTNFFLGIVLSIYFLLAKEKLHAQIRKFLQSCFDGKKYSWITQSARLANDNFGAYIKGQIADTLIIGFCSYVGFFLIGDVPYFPLVSLIFGLSSLIPFIGSYIGLLLGVLIVFLVEPSPGFVMLALTLMIVNSVFIYPRLIRVNVDTSTMFMFAAIVIMTGLIGFWGLVIGVPVFVILYTLLHSVVDRRLQQKGLSSNLSDYYGTEIGKKLFDEREEHRTRIKRRNVKKQKKREQEKEAFAEAKQETASEKEAPADESVNPPEKDSAAEERVSQ
ncbi:MAG: AI-2E family transporter [Clostridia bacterium]|nr:AI-2E family transporter [Clostridia bacterium]